MFTLFEGGGEVGTGNIILINQSQLIWEIYILIEYIYNSQESYNSYNSLSSGKLQSVASRKFGQQRKSCQLLVGLFSKVSLLEENLNVRI